MAKGDNSDQYKDVAKKSKGDSFQYDGCGMGIEDFSTSANLLSDRAFLKRYKPGQEEDEETYGKDED